ncbi:MAG TPA: phosphatase PAP2 family protein [Mycobacteriales bacterium]|nr:phosphatase PAP2 family protein [Mycobacteriales bacterium]
MPNARWLRPDSARPPRWWQELGFIAAVYGLYTLIRNAVPGHEVAARHRAHSIIHIESWLHIDIEHTLNRFVATTQIDHVHWLAYVSDYYYATLHFVVTIAVLVWLYRWHPLRYRSIRSVLIITNLGALVGFWLFSLAPPRMLPNFVDTIVQFHTWGSWASPGVDSASNQFAAMPSLHIAWSLWCAIAIVKLAKRRWVRVLGALYPAATLFVILGTANHFVLDAVGGVAALGVGILGQRLLPGRPAYARRDLPVHEAVADPEPVAA